MKNKPHLSDVMTSAPETIHLGQPLSEAYTLLQNRTFHHVPVIDGSRPVGMIAASDILRLVYDIDGTDDRMLRTFLDHQFTLEDAMTTDLETVSVGEPLHTVITKMSDGAIHSVLVLDDDGALVGIVTSTDLIQALGALV